VPYYVCGVTFNITTAALLISLLKHSPCLILANLDHTSGACTSLSISNKHRDKGPSDPLLSRGSCSGFLPEVELGRGWIPFADLQGSHIHHRKRLYDRREMGNQHGKRLKGASDGSSTRFRHHPRAVPGPDRPTRRKATGTEKPTMTADHPNCTSIVSHL